VLRTHTGRSPAETVPTGTFGQAKARVPVTTPGAGAGSPSCSSPNRVAFRLLAPVQVVSNWRSNRVRLVPDDARSTMVYRTPSQALPPSVRYA